MMPFADHDKGDSRARPFDVLLSVESAASISQSRQLFFEHYLVLAFSNPITVNEDIVRSFSLCSIPNGS